MEMSRHTKGSSQDNSGSGAQDNSGSGERGSGERRSHSGSGERKSGMRTIDEDGHCACL